MQYKSWKESSAEKWWRKICETTMTTRTSTFMCVLIFRCIFTIREISNKVCLNSLTAILVRFLSLGFIHINLFALLFLLFLPSCSHKVCLCVILSFAIAFHLLIIQCVCNFKRHQILGIFHSFALCMICSTIYILFWMVSWRNSEAYIQMDGAPVIVWWLWYIAIAIHPENKRFS